MNRFLHVLKNSIFILGLFFVCSFVFSACGASTGIGPTSPISEPVTIECSSVELGDYLAVQTMNTLSFEAKDANGDRVNGNLVTTIISDSDGTVITDGSYGAVSVNTDGTMTYAAPDDFPDRESVAHLDFENASGTNIGSENVGISINPLQIDSAVYNFENSLISENRFRPRLALTSDGVLYVQMAYNADMASGEAVELTSTSDEGTSFSAIQTLLDAEPDEHDIAAYGTGTLASYIHYGTKEIPSAGHLKYRVDEGAWSDGITFDQGNGGHEYVDMQYDANGILHIVYTYYNIDGDDSVGSIYYKHCSAASCSAALKINSVDKTTYYEAAQIAVYKETDDLVRVYIVWQDNALDVNTDDFDFGEDSYSYTALTEVNYVPTTDTASLIQTVGLQDYTGYNVGYAGDFADIVIDKNGVPVISWPVLVLTYIDVAPLYESVLKMQIGRYDTASGTMKGVTDVTTFSNTNARNRIVPVLSVDYSNYNHVVWFYAPAGGVLPSVNYTMGSFTGSGDDLTFTQSIDAQEVFSANIDIGSAGRQAIDSISDNAGRVYISWSDLDTNDLYLTVGNIR